MRGQDNLERNNFNINNNEIFVNLLRIYFPRIFLLSLISITRLEREGGGGNPRPKDRAR